MVAILVPGPSHADEIAPGVPVPDFGYALVAPKRPAEWPQEPRAGSYYIDNSHAKATDRLNQYGTPLKPRETLPNGRLSGGSYVEIHGGPYDKPNEIIANGTLKDPVWLSGQAAEERPTFRKPIRVRGRNLIIESLSFDRSRNTIEISKGSSNIVVRDSVFSGPQRADGFAAVIGFGGSPDSPIHDILLMNNEIHGFGDSRPQAPENDYHAIKISRNCHKIWILGNKAYDMAGDSVQIGDATLPDDQRCHHVYIANNHFHHNKENAVDIKNSQDVIISNNTIHSFTSSTSSDAVAIVIHDGGDNIWVIGNCVHDSSIGIINTEATNTWFVANEIYDITAGPNFETNSYYGLGVAMHMRGNSTGGIVGNFLYRYDKGVQLASGRRYEVVGNIFASRHSRDSYDVMIASTGLAKRVIQDFNLYESFSARVSSSSYSSLPQYRRFEHKERRGENAKVFQNSSVSSTLSLLGASMSNESEVSTNVYDAFRNRFGMELSLTNKTTGRFHEPIEQASCNSMF